MGQQTAGVAAHPAKRVETLRDDARKVQATYEEAVRGVMADFGRDLERMSKRYVTLHHMLFNPEVVDSAITDENYSE